MGRESTRMKCLGRHSKREQFFEVFGAHVQCIGAVEVPQVLQDIVPFETFRALLICTHLDTLAKARLGGKSSGGRFRKLLEQEPVTTRPIGWSRSNASWIASTK
jgi:hypothetical protein